jgi:hypothetical protein
MKGPIMAALNVAQLRTEAEQKYTDLPIETSSGALVHLRNLLRLPDEARKSAQVLMGSLDGKKGDDAADVFDQLGHQEAVLRDLFLLVADDLDEMKREIESWDLALRLYVFEKWSEGTQAGEASSSAN